MIDVCPVPFRRLLTALCSLLFLVAVASADTVTVRIKDTTGAVVPGAAVTIQNSQRNFERVVESDQTGTVSLPDVPAGRYEVTVHAKGFGVRTATVRTNSPGETEVVLQPGGLTEEIEVIGTELVSNVEVARRIPGSVEVIEPQALERTHVYNFSEALRKAAGVNVRDEEGFGLRPNIGLRGLNPTRSSKVLLLEDGVPLAYAPYGDNASYYHPPIERFRSIEVLKGSGQIQYGPSTVGGVINYITPDPPSDFGGAITLFGGNRDFLNGQLRLGGTWRGIGMLADVMRKQGDGARDNVKSKLDDANFKVFSQLGTRQTISLKFNRYAEDSQVTYSGLTLSEWNQNPRQNPFKNDVFFGNRIGASVHHTLILNSRMVLATNAYGANFDRKWWRQSSNSGQRPNDAGDPACAGMQNLYTTCGNEGRLRSYTTWGIEPRLRMNIATGSLAHEVDFGVRAHFEHQERRQQNGDTPTARWGLTVENNQRLNDAYSAFVQDKLNFGRLTITPGVRIERVFFERTNRLGNAGVGVSGKTALTQVVPGIGAAYNLNNSMTLFAGVHRGFAPPRTEDVVSNTGGVVELDPELSWNYEVGFRSAPMRALKFDATYFRMDYENQIIPASLAGGVGAALTNAGETRHQGGEFSARFDLGTQMGWRHNFYVRTAYTWVADAQFVGTRFSNISGFTNVLITGNRLPYAPEHTATTSFGYSHPRGLDVVVEAVNISDQFTDDLNTVASTEDGQRGVIPGNTTWNAAVNYHSEVLRSTFFVTVKNLADETFLVDRSRGMIPNNPRLVQGGMKYTF